MQGLGLFGEEPKSSRLYSSQYNCLLQKLSSTWSSDSIYSEGRLSVADANFVPRSGVRWNWDSRRCLRFKLSLPLRLGLQKLRTTNSKTYFLRPRSYSLTPEARQLVYPLHGSSELSKISKCQSIGALLWPSRRHLPGSSRLLIYFFWGWASDQITYLLNFVTSIDRLEKDKWLRQMLWCKWYNFPCPHA